MTGMLTPMVWITAPMVATIVYRRIHPPGKPMMRYEFVTAAITYMVLIVLAVFVHTFVNMPTPDPIMHVPSMPSTPWGPTMPSFDWMLDTIT